MLSYIALFPANIAQTSANIGVDAPTAHYDASAEFMGIGVSLDHVWGHFLTSFTNMLIFLHLPVNQNVPVCRFLLGSPQILQTLESTLMPRLVDISKMKCHKN